MRKNLIYRRAWGACLLLVVSSFSPISADTIIIGADEWCPINCEPGSERPGFLVETARAVFEKAGHNLEYVKMPWSRTLDEVRKGRINGAIGAYFQDAPDFIFPENLMVS